jgi:hypothetical protein
MNHRAAAVCLIATSLGSCGTIVPKLHEFYEDNNDEKITETQIVDHVKCEIYNGFAKAINGVKENDETLRGAGKYWLESWGAQVTLTLQADETGGITPIVGFNAPYANKILNFPNGAVTIAQSFSLGIGANASSHATRKEAIGFTYAFADLNAHYNAPKTPGAIAGWDRKTPWVDGAPWDGTRPLPIRQCANAGGHLLYSDLKIVDFVNAKAEITTVALAPRAKDEKAAARDAAIADINKKRESNGSPSSSPYSTFSDEITFVVTYGASVTPTWKLSAISTSPSGVSTPLLNALRTKTQDVIITLGAVKPSVDGKPASLSGSEAAAEHNAQLIGQAVAASIKGQQP